MWMKYLPCVLATGNVHEIVPHTVSGKCKTFYVVRNVHTMNTKLTIPIHFLGIPNRANTGNSVFLLVEEQ